MCDRHVRASCCGHPCVAMPAKEQSMVPRSLRIVSLLVATMAVACPGCAHHHPHGTLRPGLAPPCSGYSSTCWHSWSQECATCPSFALPPQLNALPSDGKSANVPQSTAAEPSIAVPAIGADMDYIDFGGGVLNASYLPWRRPEYRSAQFTAPVAPIRLPPVEGAE
jgi:hypothetical protein